MSSAKPSKELGHYRPLGPTFRRRRLELGLTLENVVAETRIQKAQLQAIENGSYLGLNHSVHTLGFVRRYAKLLDLDQGLAASAYLNQRGPLPKVRSQLIRQRVARPLVGSRILSRALFIAIAAAITAYLIWQLAILTTPPRLNVSYPPDNQLIYGGSLEVRGQTNPGAQIKVNGQQVYIDDKGNFSVGLDLGEGLNLITVEARNSAGKTTTVERSILVRSSANP